MQGRCRAHDCWRPRRAAAVAWRSSCTAPVAQVLPEPRPRLPRSCRSRRWRRSHGRSRRCWPSCRGHLAGAGHRVLASGNSLRSRLGVRPAQRTSSAASRSQPQRQGVQRNRRNQRTSRYRDQGDHRKAVRGPQLKELDSGSWVIFDLPGFTTAASGTPQSSLDALRKASATSYYKGKGALWVKVVSSGEASAAAALAPAEPASRSAGKLDPVV